MRHAILGAFADTFDVLVDGLHFEPRSVDEFSKRRPELALRQPAVTLRSAGVRALARLGISTLTRRLLCSTMTLARA